MSNNSSGMCCGVSQNSYHTLKDMRVVMVDGTVLDTADPVSRESFLRVRLAWAASGGARKAAGQGTARSVWPPRGRRGSMFSALPCAP